MVAKARPSLFDAEQFAHKLRGWMADQGLQGTEVARRSGLSHATIVAMRRGGPPPRRVGQQQSFEFSVTALASLARGLGLSLPYVLSWAGFKEGDRWRSFTPSERHKLAHALKGDASDSLADLLDRYPQPEKEIAWQP